MPTSFTVLVLMVTDFVEVLTFINENAVFTGIYSPF